MEKHIYFSDASFGRSMTCVTEDLRTLFHNWNIQFKFTEDMSDKRSLTAPSGITLEELAEEFGEFMRQEFLSTVKREDEMREKLWEEGEKKVEVDQHGNITTSLLNELETIYKPVEGKFAVVGEGRSSAAKRYGYTLVN